MTVVPDWGCPRLSATRVTIPAMHQVGQYCMRNSCEKFDGVSAHRDTSSKLTRRTEKRRKDRGGKRERAAQRPLAEITDGIASETRRHRLKNLTAESLSGLRDSRLEPHRAKRRCHPRTGRRKSSFWLSRGLARPADVLASTLRTRANPRRRQNGEVQALAISRNSR